MQGFGKPGRNSGGTQQGTPVDTSFYFPGYAEGGIIERTNALQQLVFPTLLRGVSVVKKFCSRI
jgi:trimethylamine-N-oxide reductase (cytochrome c)